MRLNFWKTLLMTHTKLALFSRLISICYWNPQIKADFACVLGIPFTICGFHLQFTDSACNYKFCVSVV